MTLNKLASLISKREGKKSQVRIGDLREVLAILADIAHERGVTDIAYELIVAGEKRAKRKARGK